MTHLPGDTPPCGTTDENDAILMLPSETPERGEHLPPVEPSPVPLATLLLVTLSTRMTSLDYLYLAHPSLLNPEPPRHEREPRSEMTQSHFAPRLAAVYPRPGSKDLT